MPLLSDQITALVPAAKQQESDLAAAQQQIVSLTGDKGALAQQVQSLSDQLKATQAQLKAAQTPTTVPAPAPAPVDPSTLVPWTKTQAALNAPGALVKLQPGNYEVADTTVLRANTVYDWTGVRFVATKPVVMFKFGGDNVITANGDFDSIWPRTLPKGTNPRVSVIAFDISGRGHKISFPTFRNIDGGIYLQIGAGDIDIICPHATADIRCDAIYCGGRSQDETQPRGPMRVWGPNFEDSEQEHGVRNSTPGFTGGLWVNGFYQCTNNKEPLALRAARGQTFINGTVVSTMGVYVGGSGVPAAGSEPANLAFNSLQLHGGGYYNVGINAHDITVDGGSVDIRADLVAPGMEPVVFACNGGVRNVTFKNMTRNIYGNSGKPWYRNNNNPGVPDAQVITDGGGNVTAQK